MRAARARGRQESRSRRDVDARFVLELVGGSLTGSVLTLFRAIAAPCTRPARVPDAHHSDPVTLPDGPLPDGRHGRLPGPPAAACLHMVPQPGTRHRRWRSCGSSRCHPNRCPRPSSPDYSTPPYGHQWLTCAHSLGRTTTRCSSRCVGAASWSDLTTSCQAERASRCPSSAKPAVHPPRRPSKTAPVAVLLDERVTWCVVGH